MARKTTIDLTCDICRRPTEAIVGKLQFIPRFPGISKLVHSHYSHHLDVGVCCKAKLFKAFDFHERMTAAEYQEKRRKAS